MADRHRDQALHPVGGEHGEPPGQGGAPVVADHRGPPHPKDVEHAGDIGDQDPQLVRLDVGRAGRLAEAAQVGGEHPHAGAGQGLHLVAPELPGVGEAVQQHHRRAILGPGVGQVQVDAVGRHRALGRRGHPDPAS
jgi:hypothetical protein